MSIQLANDEKIIRQYEYATAQSWGLAATNRSKTLVVTNKRIIHKEVSEGTNTAAVNMSEMPVKAAKYVNTSFKRMGYPIFLVLAILFGIASVFMLATAFGSVDANHEDEAVMMFVMAFFSAAFCAAFVVLYLKKKDYLFACTIDTDTHITPAFGVSSMSGSSRTRGIFHFFGSANKSFAIKVKVNSEVAQQMANELGYIVAAAANGDFDEVA